MSGFAARARSTNEPVIVEPFLTGAAVSTHLYLVSAQATPNLTPALDSQVAPRRVILLVSPDMHLRADWLERLA